MTVSTPRHLYTTPDGSAWIYEATTTGYCSSAAPAPAYTVPRSATRQGGASTN